MAFDPTYRLTGQPYTIPVVVLGGSVTPTTFNVPGVQVGMGAVVNVRAVSPYGAGLYAYVSAAGVVSVSYNAFLAVSVAQALTIDLHVVP